MVQYVFGTAGEKETQNMKLLFFILNSSLLNKLWFFLSNKNRESILPGGITPLLSKYILHVYTGECVGHQAGKVGHIRMKRKGRTKKRKTF